MLNIIVTVPETNSLSVGDVISTTGLIVSTMMVSVLDQPAILPALSTALTFPENDPSGTSLNVAESSPPYILVE